MSERLGVVPLVRRMEYLEAYLEGVREGKPKDELESSLVDKKEELEREKRVALGRGQVAGAKSKGAVYLLRYCFRLSRDLGLISVGDSNVISDSGVYFLESGKRERVRLLAERYSEVYPHLSVLLGVLLKMDGRISLHSKKELFDSESDTESGCF